VNWPQDQFPGAFGHGGWATMGEGPNGPGRGGYRAGFGAARGLNSARGNRGHGQLNF
jgi:hypothetical protein